MRHDRATYGLRGAAILWIVIEHVGADYDMNFLEGINIVFLKLTRGVVFPLDVFLILSGLFVAGTALTKGRDFSLREFLVRRGTRLLPPYYLFILAIFGMVAFYHPPRNTIINTMPPPRIYTVVSADAGGLTVRSESGAIERIEGQYPNARPGDEFASNSPYMKGRLVELYKPPISIWPYIVFAQDFHPQTYRMFMLAHTWFVMVIAHFYLALGVVMWMLKHIDRREVREAAFGAICIAAIICLRTFPVKTNLMAPYEAIVAGCLLALAMPHIEPYFARLKKWRADTLALATGLALVAYFLTVTPATVPYSNLVTLASALLIVLAVYAGGPVASYVFDNRALSLLGRYSYGIYLTHGALVMIAVSEMKSRGISTPMWISFSLIAAISLALGIGFERSVRLVVGRFARPSA